MKIHVMGLACVSLGVSVLGGCAVGGGSAPGELALSADDYDALSHTGVTHVVSAGEQRWWLLGDDDARLGEVRLDRDGTVAAEVGGVAASFTEDDTHLGVVCGSASFDLTRDASTGEWLGHDAQSVSTTLAPCAVPLLAGRAVRAAAARAPSTQDRSVAGDVAGRSEALECNWRRIGDQMDRYTRMCQSWGYDQGVFHYTGCTLTLDYCIEW